MDELTYQVKLPFGRDLYENWYNIEKSIMKFDRIFNKVEVTTDDVPVSRIK